MFRCEGSTESCADWNGCHSQVFSEVDFCQRHRVCSTFFLVFSGRRNRKKIYLFIVPSHSM